MDSGLLAIAQRGGNDRRGCVGVLLDVDVEDIGNGTLCRAKGSNNNSCVDWIRGYEELDGNVFLRLYTQSSLVRQSELRASLYNRIIVTYNLEFRLAAVLNTHWEGSLESTLVLQQQEGLMRPLRLATVLRRQANCKGFLSVESDSCLERGFGAESVRKSQQLA